MLSKNRKRRAAIIRRLCELSRGGWRHATRSDYQPLEHELRQLEKLARRISA